jgi:DNA-binding transcriptional ArsR family regulator
VQRFLGGAVLYWRGDGAGDRGRNMEEKLMWDLLPEEFPYEDRGCELFPSCLNCPFPDCIREEPWGKEKFLKRRRAERMMELKREGKSIGEIARIFELSTRTVQRWLKVLETCQDVGVRTDKER